MTRIKPKLVIRPARNDPRPPGGNPWNDAIKGRGELLIVRRLPDGTPDLVEAAVIVPRRVFYSLARSGLFQKVGQGILARRGRVKKATNIFVVMK